MAKSEVIELLQRYITLINAEGFSVQKAFLFGSYSTNTASDESDIDVMLVSSIVNEDDDIAIGTIWKLTKKINNRIEPFVISEKRFNNADSPLIQMIKEKGVSI